MLNKSRGKKEQYHYFCESGCKAYFTQDQTLREQRQHTYEMKNILDSYWWNAWANPPCRSANLPITVHANGPDGVEWSLKTSFVVLFITLPEYFVSNLVYGFCTPSTVSTTFLSTKSI